MSPHRVEFFRIDAEPGDCLLDVRGLQRSLAR